MNFPRSLVRGTLIKRYKRFLADVRLPDGTEVTAHCPNSGSMKTCAQPGWPVWLMPAAPGAKRKLKWTWVIVEADGALALVDTSMPNHIVKEAIQADRIPELAGYGSLRAEVRYGSEKSRIDLLLEDPGLCYVEVKNVTLLHGPGVASFPDAVTSRGTRHLRELAREVEAGNRGVLVFTLSRGDAECVVPADAIDPTYGRTLREVAQQGVEILAYRVNITSEAAILGKRVPVDLA